MENREFENLRARVAAHEAAAYELVAELEAAAARTAAAYAAATAAYNAGTGGWDEVLAASTRLRDTGMLIGAVKTAGQSDPYARMNAELCHWQNS